MLLDFSFGNRVLALTVWNRLPEAVVTATECMNMFKNRDSGHPTLGTSGELNKVKTLSL